MSDAELPQLRASDGDRERVAERLRQAAGEGRLDVEELSERLARAYAARTVAELETLTADVVPAATRPPSAGAGPLVRPGVGGTTRVISIMGGNDRRGRWRVAPRCLVFNLMGGSDLDLTQAELSEQVTTLTVISIMGGSEIRVPHGVDVQVSKFALMGGHDVKLDDAAPPPGAPVIQLRMFAIMGGGEVRQGPKKSKRKRADSERAELDR